MPTIDFVIQKEKSKYNFLTYNVILLGSNKRVLISKCGEISFINSNIHNISLLSRHELLSNIELYLPNRKLTLQCDISLIGEYDLERYELGTSDPLFKPKPMAVIPSLYDARYDLWKNNMRKFYNDGKFSDLVVCTHSRSFPVYKAILCAQSGKFRKMITENMTETNSGVIKITDLLKDETVSKLLMYLHTSILDYLDCALAKELLWAAHEFQIEALKLVCSKYLMETLDTSNVCEILQLADHLRDQELKSRARDFIAIRRHEIMNSEEWKILREVNLDLVAKTTEWMALNNSLSYRQ